MKRIILIVAIALTLITLGCVSEKKEITQPSVTTTTTVTVTPQISEPTANMINETDIDYLIQYMNEIENISFNI